MIQMENGSDESRVLEVIREFANVGAGNAATALASFLDMELVNEVTTCNMLPLARVAHWLGSEEQIVAGVYTQLCGDLRSGILVVFPSASAQAMLKHITKQEVDLSNLDAIQLSALREIGNICLCWYLVAVSRMIDTDLVPAPPDATVDMLASVLSLPLANLAVKVDTVIAVHTYFKGVEKDFEGYFLMLPEERMLKEIMDKMGEK
jgi:chemotaxis protein CheC